MTQPLLEPIDRYFGPGARMRGERYLEEGRVHLRRLDERAIAAEVRGTRRYDVSLKFDETSRTWEVFCSCDAFAAMGPCKHVWATIQAARTAQKDEKRGNGVGAPVRTRVRESRDSPLGELRALASRSAASRSLPGTQERRLVYALSFDRDVSDPGAVVTISWQVVKKRGGWSSPKAFPLREHDERFEGSAEDRAIIEPLRGATGDGQWRYGSAWLSRSRSASSRAASSSLGATSRRSTGAERGSARRS